MTSETSAGERRTPGRVSLEDFIEAVASGVTRAIEAHADTVGHLQAPPAGGRTGTVGGPVITGPFGPGPWIIGIIYNPTGLPGQAVPAGGAKLEA